MSHLQALISRNIVHIVLQFYLSYSFCLSGTIALGTPSAIVPLRSTEDYICHLNHASYFVPLCHLQEYFSVVSEWDGKHCKMSSDTT